MFRNIMALVSGYLVFSLGALILYLFTDFKPNELPTLEYALISGSTGGLTAFAGGYLTAVIMKDSSRRVLWVLSSLIAGFALLSLLAQPGVTHWTQLLSIFMFAPLAFLGGSLRLHRSTS